MQTFQPTIDFNTDIGASTSAATGITPYRIDCKVNGVEKNLALLIKSINGQGGTPTSPGSSVSFTAQAAFCEDTLSDVTMAPTVLSGRQISTECTLPNTSSSTLAGTSYYGPNALIPILGPNLYVWLDHEAFAATTAVVNVQVSHLFVE